MSFPWPEIPLSAVLTERVETPDENAVASGEQPIISKIRFADGGIEFRPDRASKTKLISVHPGDIVLSGINARKGGIGLYPHSTRRKAAATIHYSTYAVNPSKAVPRFLWMFFRHEVFQEILTRHVPLGIKTELKADRFLTLPVPMPPVEEQKRLVERVDQVASRITKARELHSECCTEVERLLARIITVRTSSLAVNGQLKDVLTGKPRNGWSAKCDNADDGTPVLTLTAVRGFQYCETAIKRTSLTIDENAYCWLKPDDVLISRSNSIDLVGHAAIYNGKPKRCIYPDLLMRLPIDKARVHPRFLVFWLQSSLVRDYIRAHAKGTSPSMKKINQAVVMRIPFPTGLEMVAQRALIREFEDYGSRLTSLHLLHAEAAAELDVMPSAVLGQAFRGKL